MSRSVALLYAYATLNAAKCCYLAAVLPSILYPGGVGISEGFAEVQRKRDGKALKIALWPLGLMFGHED